MILESLHVLGHIAPGQQTAVHCRVQGLDAAIEHFRKLRDLCHLGHRQSCISQQLGGTTCGQQIDAQGRQGSGKLGDAGFVGYGNKCVHAWTHEKIKKRSSNVKLRTQRERQDRQKLLSGGTSARQLPLQKHLTSAYVPSASCAAYCGSSPAIRLHGTGCSRRAA